MEKMTTDTSRRESPPKDEKEVRARHESNRRGWNEGAVHYTQNLDKAVEFIRSGQSNLHPVERRNLGDLKSWCKTAIHLQCASGMDTLSLWNEGVEKVIGVDISDVHIENARKLTELTGAPAEWYRCDVLDTPHHLDGTADLVYTGRGAICWMQDLDAWAKVIYRLLKPGGIFHIFDDHPFTYLLDMETDDLTFYGSSYFSYFESGKGWPSTYIGELDIPLEQQARKYEGFWNFMDIFNALRGADLVIDYLGEHPEQYWDNFPNLKPEIARLIPMTFSIKARKP